MKLCIDTSAYSAFRRSHPTIQTFIERAERLSFSSVVLGELLGGFQRGNRNKANRASMDEFIDTADVQLLSVDEETADRYAMIYADLRKRGRPMPTNDMWLAANAMQHGYRILTLDRHFSDIPQVRSEIVDPL